MKCLCKSVTFCPDSSCSSSIEPITTISSPSSLIQIGIGVPQYLFLEMAQSCAFSSQLWNRFSCT